MQIPIENIYFLLCYAWNKLDEKDRIKVDLDGNTELLDLLAQVLKNGTKVLLKRGIEKSYIEEEVELAGIKGKFQVSSTIKRGSLRRRKTICSFDEFSGNVLTNQIIYTTLFKLLKTKELNTVLKGAIKKLLYMFPLVDLIELKSSLFKEVRLHRNNRFYGFLINVCQLLYENSLPSEKQGEWKFMDFSRDENKMNQLFEAFIFNFYRMKLSNWSVSRPHIKWQFSSTNDADQKYVPIMKTDITLLSNDAKIIMDAKYYRETLSSYHSTEKIKSANLYQIFSYLLNQRDGSAITVNAKGILLYPTIEEEFDLHYSYETHPSK